MNYFPLILGLLPSFIWLFFFLSEDKKHPEPKKMILLAFVAGAVTTFIVLFAQSFINKIFLIINVENYSPISLFVFSFLEETFKFGAVYYVISKTSEFDEPIDAMIYMITVALGFAAVENIAAAYKSPLTPLALETTTLRFFGATLLHTLSSGLVGYYWAKSILLSNKKILMLGLILATSLHAIFNYLIIRYEPIIIPTIFLITFALFILYFFEKLKKR
jgi:protease PrsW